MNLPSLHVPAQRIDQLARLSAKLAAGQPLSEHDVALALHSVDQAHTRARRAHLATAERRRQAAQTHERVARAHDESANQGIGDIDAHRRAAATHRAARDDDYRSADEALRLAESERAHTARHDQPEPAMISHDQPEKEQRSFQKGPTPPDRTQRSP